MTIFKCILVLSLSFSFCDTCFKNQQILLIVIRVINSTWSSIKTYDFVGQKKNFDLDGIFYLVNSCYESEKTTATTLKKVEWHTLFWRLTTLVPHRFAALIFMQKYQCLTEKLTLPNNY